MLIINNYSKIYPNGKKAVTNLSLHVERGDIFGFIGHNGAGKTTTIKSIVGILAFEEGDILIDNVSIKEKPLDCKTKIAYIPDNPELYESLTGMQYINFISDVYKVSKEKRIALVNKYATAFDLTNELNNYISSYSHGMKQKLALIAAFIHEPKLLIMDEPFVGLDPKAAFTVKAIMREMCEDGCAIFFSTHVLEVAQKLCTKIAIIKKGELIIQGNMDEIVGDESLEDVFMELTEHA